MSLKAADVAEIMKIVEDSSFDELTLEIDGLKLSLRRGATGVVNGAAADGAPWLSSQDSGGAASAAAGARGGETSAAAAGAQRAAAASGSTGGGGRAPASSGGAAHASGAALASQDPNAHEVAAPLLGTFYRAPKPGAPPFVDIGSTVEADTVVGIIEVMKLMNTVRAGVRGVVTEIFATDGALVEYDEILLRVRKAG